MPKFRYFMSRVLGREGALFLSAAFASVAAFVVGLDWDHAYELAAIMFAISYLLLFSVCIATHHAAILLDAYKTSWESQASVSADLLAKLCCAENEVYRLKRLLRDREAGDGKRD